MDYEGDAEELVKIAKEKYMDSIAELPPTVDGISGMNNEMHEVLVDNGIAYDVLMSYVNVLPLIVTC